MATGRLANKVAVVTGSTGAIGRAIAFAYHEQGAHVVCADINEHSKSADDKEKKCPTHEAIREQGGKAIFSRVDVSDSKSVESLVQNAVDEYGRLDIMVNNAGVSIEAQRGFKPIWKIPSDTWSLTQDVNSTGVFHGVKFAVAQMLRQDPHPCGSRGWIINTSSILAFVGAPHTAAYCASKGAVLNLTRAAALDCAPHRIHVNGVAPGYTASNMTAPIWADPSAKQAVEAMHPFRGLGRPEDLARVCVFLASEDAAWVTGVTVPVEGGYLSR